MRVLAPVAPEQDRSDGLELWGRELFEAESIQEGGNLALGGELLGLADTRGGSWKDDHLDAREGEHQVVVLDGKR